MRPLRSLAVVDIISPRTISALAVALCAVFCFTPAGASSIPAYDLVPGAVIYRNAYYTDQTAGLEFTANSNITVTALGFVDSTGIGLNEAHLVGIFDVSTQKLITDPTATVAAGTVDPLVGAFRYADITPVTLTAGSEYIIVGRLPTTGDLVGYTTPAGLIPSPAFTLVNAVYGLGPGLVYPPNPSPSGTYVIANFEYTTATAVPEPATLVLAGMGILGVGYLRYISTRRRPMRPQAPSI
ncbi:MAG: PEP-CTERM sorting domain-containing protein [Isosphaeraceae bacterium]